MRYLLPLYLIIITTCFKTYGQSSNVDSLKSALESSDNDLNKCEILINLIQMEANDNIWSKYNDQLLTITNGKINKISEPPTEEQISYLKYYSTASNNSGYIQYNQGNYNGALDQYTKSLKVLDKIKDKNGSLRTLINIGNVYADQGDQDKALTEFQKAFELANSIEDKDGMALSLINIGNILKTKNKIDLALEKYLDALMLTKETNDKIGLASCYYKVSLIYKLQNELEKAIDYNNKSMEISSELNDKKGISVTLNNQAELLFLKNDLNNSFLLANKGLEISKELGYPEEIMNSSKILTQLYKKQNKPVLALEMYEQYIKMRDSINNKETRKAILQKQYQSEYEKKALADSLKTVEENKTMNLRIEKQEAQIKQDRTQKFALYGGLLIVILFAGLMFNRFKVTQKQKELIEKQKELVEEKNHIIQEKQTEIIASINYAKRIQTAQLPNNKYIQKHITRLKK